jgi:hypothetical protein
MKTPLKVLIFGFVSGLVWSVTATFAYGPFGAPTAPQIVSGVLAGVIVSFAVGATLMRFRKKSTIILGALSLPAGAFLYGFILSIIEWVFVGGESGDPLVMGYLCVLMSVVSVFAILFFPLAILTTLLLRRVVVPVKPNA